MKLAHVGLRHSMWVQQAVTHQNFLWSRDIQQGHAIGTKALSRMKTDTARHTQRNLKKKALEIKVLYSQMIQMRCQVLFSSSAS